MGARRIRRRFFGRSASRNEKRAEESLLPLPLVQPGLSDIRLQEELAAV